MPTDGTIPDDSKGTIQLRLRTLSQLFNSMDPSPFNDRDIDPEAEEWIVSSAKEAPPEASLRLVIHLQDSEPQSGEDDAVPRAVHAHFARLSELARRELKQLLQRGRKSLAIGLTVVAAMVLIGDLAHPWLGGGRLADVVRESLLIGGWVAMWRPLEIFLYDWWPIRAQRVTLDRLATIEVELKRCGWRCEHDLAVN